MNLQFKLQMKKDKFKKFQIFNLIFSSYFLITELLVNGNLIWLNMRYSLRSNSTFYIFLVLLILLNCLPIIFFKIINNKRMSKFNNEIIVFIFKNIIYIIIILVIGIIFLKTIQYMVANAMWGGGNKVEEIDYMRLYFVQTFLAKSSIVMNIITIVIVFIEIILFNKCYEWSLEHKNVMIEDLSNKSIGDSKEGLLNNIEELDNQIKRSEKTIIGVLGGIIIVMFIKDIINFVLQAKIWLINKMAWSFIPLILKVGTIYIVFKICIFKNFFNRIIESDSSKKRKLLLKWKNNLKLIAR